ncbi:MAG TPA: metallophosphoesterase [Vicinamibacterales bacterium]
MARAAPVAVLAVLAVLSPTFASRGSASLVALLLVVAGLVEIRQGFRRPTPAGQRAAWMGGVITVAIGVLITNAAALAATGIVVLLSGWFAADAVRYVVRGLRGDYEGRATAWLLPALGNAGSAVLLILLRQSTLDWTLALAGGLRIGGTAWNIASSPAFAVKDAGRTAVADLRLPDLPELAQVIERIATEEEGRAPVDRGWIVAFVVTLFAIHLGRMGFDRSRLGISSPLVAVVGDLFLALVIAYAVIVPLLVAGHGLTRGLQRWAWRWCLGRTAVGWAVWPQRLVRSLLERRLRVAYRMRTARYSARMALRRGLQIGLPFAAVIASIVPVFGVSWFFDSENWAAGMWNAWAEARTDTWREAMVTATFEGERAKEPSTWYSVAPPGLDHTRDFAFLVIGDPGEGDASQHALRDQVLTAASRDEVKFVVISSDVIYPTGAMRDYEKGFWLPMKGVRRPVYAIPGNHDWYDALEAFAATFLESGAARTAMHARVEADEGLTTTTDARIEELIGQAAFYREQYGVPTGFQRAPFFDFQTEDFALIAIDTGVVRDVDPVQLRWLEATLEEARGKTVMAVLGHPFYAGGAYVAQGDDAFTRIHDLLKRHGVSIVMAGDTHDLEYYAEPGAGPTAPVTHHFVNGGGGAYLSFGTSLAWPDVPATSRWAFYPRSEQVRSKIDANMTMVKRPLWWWTDLLQAWPFSVEWLSAAFDFNVAPFYQSFVEVRVEPSAARVRILPHGVNGRLRWSDLQKSTDLLPAGAADADLAEWVVPFR